MFDQPRVLLITPNWRWDSTPLSTDTLCPPVSPPLEMAYISSGLECEHRLIDAYAANLDMEQLVTAIEQMAPTSIVISTTPSLLYWRCPPLSIEAVTRTVGVCRSVSAADVLVIGPHPSSSPEWVLSRTGADACWLGAPEIQLARWLQGSASGDVHVYRAGRNATVCVEQAPALPVARMSVFDFDLPYLPHMWCVSEEERSVAADYRSGALVEASRGCPWSCVYCAKAPVRDLFGRRRPACVEDELAQLSQLGVDYVFFVDETFNLGGSRLRAILDTLASTGLSFGFQGRPELISAEQAEHLAQAGCVYAELGVDVNSSLVSASVGRRQSVTDAATGIEACRAAIPIVRYNRLNLETLDYRVALGLSGESGWDYPPDPAYPYPGAPLGDLVMRLYGRNEFDWEFALRYSWWLRMEVELQRSPNRVEDAELAVRQAEFLALPDADARAIAIAADAATPATECQLTNKFINGVPASNAHSLSPRTTRQERIQQR